MSRRAAPARPVWPHRVGAFLALLALAVQLAVASIVLPVATAATALDRLVAASICHAPAADGSKQPAHAPACAVCPICQAIAQGAALLPPAVFTLHVPAAVVLRAAPPPPARAPPSSALAAAWPRGPPSLI